MDKTFFLDTSCGAGNVSLTAAALQELLVNFGNTNDTIGLDQVSVTFPTNVKTSNTINIRLVSGNNVIHLLSKNFAVFSYRVSRCNVNGLALQRP